MVKLERGKTWFLLIVNENQGLHCLFNRRKTIIFVIPAKAGI